MTSRSLIADDIVLIFIGFSFGILLGGRFNVLSLVPATFIAIAVAVAEGSLDGAGIGAIALSSLLTVVGLNCGYLFGAVIVSLWAHAPSMPRHRVAEH